MAQFILEAIVLCEVGGIIGVGLPALVVASDGLTLLFAAAGLLSLCAAVMTRRLHRPGYPALHLPR